MVWSICVVSPHLLLMLSFGGEAGGAVAYDDEAMEYVGGILEA
jgi:hypothetical protein